MYSVSRIKKVIKRIVGKQPLASRPERDIDVKSGPIASDVRSPVEYDAPDGAHELLSVIVPVYNVENYLASCLESLLHQNYENIEIIVVDDGSPDRSHEIALSFADHDERIRIIRRENGGLGAARNTGIRAALGEFITFVDSDDSVPANAYKTMMNSARKSRSDVVIGALVRQRGAKIFHPEWVQEVHAQDRIGTTVSEFPSILRDFYSPNKIYRRTFWQEMDFAFREGVLFEDQPVITKALVEAGTIDVLSATTYRWLVRDDGSSLSQNMYTAEKIEARREATRLTKNFLTNRADEPTYKSWVTTLADYHFPAYLAQARKLSEEAYSTLIGMIRDILSPDILLERDDLMPQNRALIYLALTESREVVENALAHGIRDVRRNEVIRSSEGNYELRLRGGNNHVPLPRALLGFPDHTRKLKTHLHRVKWAEAGTLSIQGWAYITYVDEATVEATALEICLFSEESGQLLTRIPTTGRRIYQAAIDARDQFVDHSLAGFEASVDFHQVIAESGKNSNGRIGGFCIQIRATSPNGEVFTEILKSRTTFGSAGVLPASQTHGRVVLRQKWTRAAGLIIIAERRAIVASQLRLNQDQVELQLMETSPAFKPEALIFLDVRRVREYRFPLEIEEGQVRCLAPWPELANLDSLLEMFVESAAGLRRKLHAADSFANVESNGTVAPIRNATKAVTVRTHWDRIRVDGVEIRHDSVVVRGWFAEYVGRPVFLELSTKKARTKAVPPVRVGDHFEWTVPLRTLDAFKDEVIMGRGMYSFEFFRSSPVGTRSAKTQLLSPAIVDELPKRVDAWGVQGRIGRNAAGLRMHIISGVPLEERSEYGRRRIRESLEAVSLDENAVFFQCLIGDAATDSPLAIHKFLRRQYPEVKLYWGVLDHSVVLPDGAVPCLVQSKDWYEALHKSKFVVVNHELPSVYVKQPGQVVLQTYHGHPFKIMGVPRWREQEVSSIEIERNLEARRQWDYLLAPSPTAADLYRDAFPIDVEVLQIGHPRNDELVEIDEGRRLAIRKNLGIRPQQKAVLYAPTWRDYEASNPWVSRMSDLLNPYELAMQLGPEFVVLFRGHPAHQRHGVEITNSKGVINVTDYPQINELIIASDLGVFDYSSIRFDYSVSGKPMVFFVPDREAYFEKTPPLIRFEDTIPGPVAETNDELAGCIRNLFESPELFSASYADFVQKFNPREDGLSTERLAKLVFGDFNRQDLRNQPKSDEVSVARKLS